MHRILSLLGLFATLSCQKWQPTVEQIAELCGPELQGHPIMVFKEPDGDRLHTGDTYDFSVHFQSSAGTWRELPVNSRGCLVPPQEDGTLVARSISRGWAYARTYDSSFPRYQEVQVTEAQTSSWALTCPSAGWIADNQLQDLLTYAGSNSEVFDVQIKARSRQGSLQLVSQKKPGLSLAGSEAMQGVNLRNLDPGLYELDLFVALAGPETTIRPVSSCPLEIIRHEPMLAQDPWRDGEILRLNEKRAFLPTVVGDRLMICRSPGHGPGQEDSCEVSRACQDRKNFIEAASFSVDEPGPWTYAYFLKNRAGREGPLHCRRVYGSERAPDFNLRWQKSRWNEPGHVLSSLPAHIEATFESQGHSRDSARPEPTYSCKVEFAHDTNVIVGQGVRCLSGLCSGQSLREFVPCTSPLRLSASTAFESELLLNSEMRLTVRADDGSGQVSSRTQSLLLQHAQNYIWSTSKSLPNLQRGDQVSGYWHRPNGSLLVRLDSDKKDRFLELPRASGGAKPENWHEIPAFLPTDRDFRTTEVSISEQGSVMVSWYSRRDNVLYNEFSRLIDGSWTPVLPQGWDPEEKLCAFFLVEDDGTFLCYNTSVPTKPELWRLSMTKDPELIPLPNLPSHCKASLGVPQITWVRNARKELFAICHKEVAFRQTPGGSWDSFPLPTNRTLRVHTITFDEQDQPWFVMRQGKDALVVAPTRTRESIPFPAGIEGPVTTNETIGFDAAGQLRLGAYLWSAKDGIWVLDESLVSLLGTSSVQVRPIQGDRGALFFETARVTLMRTAQGQDRLFPLKSLQWSPPAFDQFTKPGILGVKLGPQGELCFSEKVQNIPHLRCILRKNWAHLGPPVTQLASIPGLQQVVSNLDGEFWAMGDDGFYQLAGDTWTRILPPLPEKNLQIYAEGDSLWATAKDRIYRLKLSEKVWQLVSQTHESEGLLIHTPTRQVLTDSLGQVWIINRIQTSNRIGTRTLVKFSGDTRSLITFPDNWDPLEIFSSGSDIIFLNEVSEAGQKRFAIHAMDIRSHAVQEHDPAQWGFDFSVFANRNPGEWQSSAHEQAAVIYDLKNPTFEPIILDFRLKRQVPMRQLQGSDSFAGLGLARLIDGSYLVTTPERSQPTSIVDNYALRRVLPDGKLQFLYDTDELRAMEDRAGLRVTIVAPLLVLDRGSRLWIKPSEANSTRPSELLQFDLEALAKGPIWKSQ